MTTTVALHKDTRNRFYVRENPEGVEFDHIRENDGWITLVGGITRDEAIEWVVRRIAKGASFDDRRSIRLTASELGRIDIDCYDSNGDRMHKMDCRLTDENCRAEAELNVRTMHAYGRHDGEPEHYASMGCPTCYVIASNTTVSDLP